MSRSTGSRRRWRYTQKALEEKTFFCGDVLGSQLGNEMKMFWPPRSGDTRLPQSGLAGRADLSNEQPRMIQTLAPPLLILSNLPSFARCLVILPPPFCHFSSIQRHRPCCRRHSFLTVALLPSVNRFEFDEDFAPAPIRSPRTLYDILCPVDEQWSDMFMPSSTHPRPRLPLLRTILSSRDRRWGARHG